jgi:hypothetical protein
VASATPAQQQNIDTSVAFASQFGGVDIRIKRCCSTATFEDLIQFEITFGRKKTCYSND